MPNMSQIHLLPSSSDASSSGEAPSEGPPHLQTGPPAQPCGELEWLPEADHAPSLLWGGMSKLRSVILPDWPPCLPSLFPTLWLPHSPGHTK